jgi:hypothetical protein
MDQRRLERKRTGSKLGRPRPSTDPQVAQDRHDAADVLHGLPDTVPPRRVAPAVARNARSSDVPHLDRLAVVFDLDGVLANQRITRRLALVSSWGGRSPDGTRAAIWGSGFEAESERGAWSANDYLRGFGERLECPVTAAA